MKGRPAASAIGCVALEVGVPTGPIRANTLSSLIGLLTAAIGFSGS